MSRKISPFASLKFMVVGIALLIFLDRVVFDRFSPFNRPAVLHPGNIENNPVRTTAVPDHTLGHTEIEDFEAAKKIRPAFAGPNLAPTLVLPSRKTYGPDRSQMSAGMPAWRKNAVAVPSGIPEPKIAIIIDDMGMDRKHSREAVALPGPLTLSFLPYAPDIKAQVQAARKAGQEIMVHVPMEPLNGTLDAGPEVLRTNMSESGFDKVLSDDLDAFSGYVGINNHMGSLATSDRATMERLMKRLKARGLLFIDSRTIANSVADSEAAAAGVPHASRDVFLDHDPDLASVKQSLEKLESVARAHGAAIAIGHPKAETLAALREWLPTLAGKGIALVPVSAVVSVPVPDNKSGLAAVSSPPAER